MFQVCTAPLTVCIQSYHDRQRVRCHLHSRTLTTSIIITWDMTVAHTLATSCVSQKVLQAGSAAAAASARKTTKYSMLSATHMFFSGGGRDSWCLVRRGSQPHCRNWQKSHALHSQSAGNYVPVPTYFSGNLAFQRSVPCQHVHSFRFSIVTIPDIHFYFC